MNFDNDIKIVGDKPSIDVKKHKETAQLKTEIDKNAIKNAKIWGKEVALKFVEDAIVSAKDGNETTNGEMLIQRQMLLSFTATAGFEEFGGDTLSGIAQKSFIDTIKQKDEKLYKTATDTCAYTFYYLAFRRGLDTERRIGQTFAMLCSHDGDPIFQELGEALYCWFMSVVKKSAEKLGIIG